jgi:hypothetical protein
MNNPLSPKINEQKKKTMTNDIGNPGHGFGQAQICDKLTS